MYPMFTYLKIKTRAGLHKMFSEERGASGTIEAVIMIGIVVVIAFIFRTQILKLFEDLWNNLVVTGVNKKGAETTDVTLSNITVPGANGNQK